MFFWIANEHLGNVTLSNQKIWVYIYVHIIPFLCMRHKKRNVKKMKLHKLDTIMRQSMTEKYKLMFDNSLLT